MFAHPGITRGALEPVQLPTEGYPDVNTTFHKPYAVQESLQADHFKPLYL